LSSSAEYRKELVPQVGRRTDLARGLIVWEDARDFLKLRPIAPRDDATLTTSRRSAAASNSGSRADLLFASVPSRSKTIASSFHRPSLLLGVSASVSNSSNCFALFDWIYPVLSISSNSLHGRVETRTIRSQPAKSHTRLFGRICVVAMLDLPKASMHTSTRALFGAMVEW